MSLETEFKKYRKLEMTPERARELKDREKKYAKKLSERKKQGLVEPNNRGRKPDKDKKEERVVPKLQEGFGVKWIPRGWKGFDDAKVKKTVNGDTMITKKNKKSGVTLTTSNGPNDKNPVKIEYGYDTVPIKSKKKKPVKKALDDKRDGYKSYEETGKKEKERLEDEGMMVPRTSYVKPKPLKSLNPRKLSVDEAYEQYYGKPVSSIERSTESLAETPKLLQDSYRQKRRKMEAASGEYPGDGGNGMSIPNSIDDDSNKPRIEPSYVDKNGKIRLASDVDDPMKPVVEPTQKKKERNTNNRPNDDRMWDEVDYGSSIEEKKSPQRTLDDFSSVEEKKAWMGWKKWNEQKEAKKKDKHPGVEVKLKEEDDYSEKNPNPKSKQSNKTVKKADRNSEEGAYEQRQMDNQRDYIDSHPTHESNNTFGAGDEEKEDVHLRELYDSLLNSDKLKRINNKNLPDRDIPSVARPANRLSNEEEELDYSPPEGYAKPEPLKRKYNRKTPVYPKPEVTNKAWKDDKMNESLDKAMTKAFREFKKIGIETDEEGNITHNYRPGIEQPRAPGPAKPTQEMAGGRSWVNEDAKQYREQAKKNKNPKKNKKMPEESLATPVVRPAATQTTDPPVANIPKQGLGSRIANASMASVGRGALAGGKKLMQGAKNVGGGMLTEGRKIGASAADSARKYANNLNTAPSQANMDAARSKAVDRGAMRDRASQMMNPSAYNGNSQYANDIMGKAFEEFKKDQIKNPKKTWKKVAIDDEKKFNEREDVEKSLSDWMKDYNEEMKVLDKSALPFHTDAEVDAMDAEEYGKKKALTDAERADEARWKANENKKKKRKEAKSVKKSSIAGIPDDESDEFGYEQWKRARDKEDGNRSEYSIERNRKAARERNAKKRAEKKNEKK